MRINKLLSNFGICSRKEANRFIDDKRIVINGVLAIPGQWVEETDDILLDNKPLAKKEKVYIVLNKPVGITCTSAPEVKDNILDYIEYGEYIFPVGRLDKQSQGLIILTNDGDFANNILNADNIKEKEYIVTVDKYFDDKFIEGMSKGVDIGDAITRPCKVTRINDDTFNIVLTQGLNKQIRRMTKAFGYNVIKLERIRILNVTIEGLDYGKWRKLTDSEIIELKDKEN